MGTTRRASLKGLLALGVAAIWLALDATLPAKGQSILPESSPYVRKAGADVGRPKAERGGLLLDAEPRTIPATRVTRSAE